MSLKKITRRAFLKAAFGAAVVASIPVGVIAAFRKKKNTPPFGQYTETLTIEDIRAAKKVLMEAHVDPIDDHYNIYVPRKIYAMWIKEYGRLPSHVISF